RIVVGLDRGRRHQRSALHEPRPLSDGAPICRLRDPLRAGAPRMVARAHPGAGACMRPRHGLVIGKFYPPHAGHHLLVRTAARACERVTVVVMAASVESLPLELRVAWMREVHEPDGNVLVTGITDDNPVDLTSDAIWRAHVELMRAAAHSVSREPID